MSAEPGAPHIGLVVEGAGDKQGVPVVMRKLFAEAGEYRDAIGKAIPCNGRGAATAPKGIEGFVSVAARRPGCVGVLVVLDSDDDEPEPLLVELQGRADSISPVPVRVCLAVTCFEDWIRASGETMDFPLDHDGGGGAVEAIKRGLAPRKYVKPVMQPKLAHRIDVNLARSRSSSFAAFMAEVTYMRSLLPSR